MSIKASWCFKSHTKNNHLSITSTKHFLTEVIAVKEYCPRNNLFLYHFFHWVGTTNNIIIFLPHHSFDLTKEKALWYTDTESCHRGWAEVIILA